MVDESEPAPPSDWLPEPAPADPEPRPAATPYGRILVTYACVLLTGVGLAWAFLSMRAVVGVGGSCASGGAYEIATPCPDGSWLIGIAIPMMLVAAFSGTGFGSTIGAPPLILPLWGLLFGTLGWNFLEFAFEDGFSFTYLVCGVMFWAFALPAWWWMVVALRDNLRVKMKLGEPRKRSKKERKAIEKARATMWRGGELDGSLWWWLIYLVLGAGGWFLGVAIYALAAA